MPRFTLPAFAGTLAAATALAFAAPVAAAPQPAPAAKTLAQRDWSKTVAATRYGGVVIGNPEAATKLVEFISYTCPHCAHFTAEASPTLKSKYIAGGRTSVEIRPYLRNPIDYAASVLVSCGGPEKFVGNHEALLADQPKWTARAQAISAARQSVWTQADAVTGITMIVADLGLDTILAKRGITPDQMTACIADPSRIAAIEQSTNAASRIGVNGTPMFTLNGTLLSDTYDWATVRAALVTATTTP